MNRLIPNEQSVPALPSAAVWEWLLFEQPWPLVLLLLAVGLVAGWLLFMRGKTKPGVLSAVLGLGLAAAVWLVAGAVETVRERVSIETRALVSAVDRGDSVVLDSMLDLDVEVSAPGAGEIRGREGVVRAVETRLPGYRVSEIKVLEVRAADDGGGVARSQVRVRASVGDGFEVHSWWELVWIQRDRDGAWVWKVRNIRALWIQGA